MTEVIPSPVHLSSTSFSFIRSSTKDQIRAEREACWKEKEPYLVTFFTAIVPTATPKSSQTDNTVSVATNIWSTTKFSKPLTSSELISVKQPYFHCQFELFLLYSRAPCSQTPLLQKSLKYWSLIYCPVSSGKEHYETKLICKLLDWIFSRYKNSPSGDFFSSIRRLFSLEFKYILIGSLMCNSESGISILCFLIKCFSHSILRAFIPFKLTFWTPRINWIYRGEM